MISHSRRPLTTVSAAMLSCAANSVYAAGFLVPETSILGLSTANAVVANPRELGAINYNPALSSFHDGTTVSGGLLVIKAESEVTPTVGTPADFQGKDYVPVPMVQVTHTLNNLITLGLGITVPLGLSTEYPAGTFGTFATTGGAIGGANGAAIAAGHPTESRVEVIDFSPTASFRLNENMSFAVGLDYYWLKNVTFDAIGVKNEGDGDGWGWNTSFAYVRGPWSFGASFRSESEMNVDGTTWIFSTGLGAFVPFPATAELTMPWRAQVGLRYQATRELAVEFDVSRTGWNSFEVLAINNPARPITSTNLWDNSNAYRIGGTYNLSGETQLRFGYSYDEMAGGLETYSARTADSDRHLFSVGVAHKLGDGLAIEAGYMLAKFDDVNLSGRSYLAQIGAGGGVDANGTDAYAGKFESTIHLFGIGLTKHFN